MLYLNETDVKKIGIAWPETIQVIADAVHCLDVNDYAQPIKPYLRYKDPQNRIIAMPAYVGGNFNSAGIKWIASFPKNIERGIPRAHSIVILNNADTGEVDAVINTTLLSIIRTASVSGLMLDCFSKERRLENITLGIIGFGPIGQAHFEMCMQTIGDKINKVYLYDLKNIDSKNINKVYEDKIVIADNWKEIYENADVFITCTVSKRPYIDRQPKVGSLILNVSLRDFKPDIYNHVKNSIVVDDWDEVCRENTDIENMHKEYGLKKEDIHTLADVVCRNFINDLPQETPIMFNPMGMGIFDIAIGNYYSIKANKINIGKILD